MKFPCATRLVCAFQYKSDAEAFYGSLCDRLGKFGLSVAEDKTRILRFCRFDLAGSGRFDFLGFEFFWARTRCGFRGVRRRTSRKKLRASLATFSAWIRSTRHRRLSVIVPILKAKYRGYWNYYGVVGNSASLTQFFYRSKRILFKWLNRRSQRRSYTWTGFQALLDQVGIHAPRITSIAQLRLL